MVDFASALQKRANEVEKPKNLPKGTYIWSVSKVPSQEEVGQNQEWTKIEFPIQVVDVTDDVDADDLEAFGSPIGSKNRVSFMFPNDPEKKNEFDRSLYQLTQFLTETLGLPGDQTVEELLPQSVNYQFMGVVVWKPGKDGEVYVNVQNFAPV